MAGNVIRQDVVQVTFDTEFDELLKLKKTLDDLKKKLGGDIGEDAFDDLKDGAKESVTPLRKIGEEAKKVAAKVAEIGNKAANKAFNGLKKLASISFKALAVGIGAAATAISGLTVKSVQAYADFEQLKGGVETLFGDGAAKTVLKNANAAFASAGLSANDYMETVTSFSASLIGSLKGDTEKAASYADMAIRDMSDNANKMGTDMSLIQNAYQGFAKQNYTMLDNLKLGYGGTQTEMQRLIKDASKLDKSVKANDMSFGNIVKAIHAVQVEMGVAGATAAEAAGTISGSLGAMKAAWGNLLTAMASGENLDQCIDNMVETVETFANNVMPIAEKALGGLGKVVDKLAPVIAKKLPGLVSKLLPPIISAAGKLVGSLVRNLPSIISALIPAIKEAGLQIVSALYEAITGKEMSSDKFESLSSALDKLLSSMKVVIPVAIALLGAFKAYSVIKTVVTSVSKFAKSVGTIASKVSGGLGKKLSDVAAGTQKTGKAAASSSKNMLATAKAFMMMAAGVLMIAAGFGILAISAIALANAGWGAIAVMAGLVVALAALGIGMMVLLKSLSTMGAQATQGAMAMLIMGAAIVLVAFGFMLLAQASIALASAGWPAIAVMAGLLAAIALLAIGAAALAPTLTAGAVGLLAFGAAIVLVGVGAILAAASLAIITSLLPMLVMYGAAGALAIAQLGLGMTVFAAGAALAGAASLILAAGLLVLSPTLILMAASMTALVAVFILLSPLALLLATSMVAVSKSMAALPKAMSKLKVSMIAGFALLVAAVKKGSNKMVDALSKTMEKLASVVAKTSLSDEGTQLIKGLIRGMNKQKSAAVSAARAIANAINREFDKVQKIHSPSKVWEDKGVNMLKGGIVGMEKTMPKFQQTANSVGEVAMPYTGKYTPESTTSSSVTQSEVNNYSPQFNLNLSGTTDKTTERTVKKWIQEALTETFDSMSRTSPRLTEV